MVFIQYHKNELMDLNKTYIEVFHFGDEIVLSGLFNKQHLWVGLYTCILSEIA